MSPAVEKRQISVWLAGRCGGHKRHGDRQVKYSHTEIGVIKVTEPPNIEC